MCASHAEMHINRRAVLKTGLVATALAALPSLTESEAEAAKRKMTRRAYVISNHNLRSRPFFMHEKSIQFCDLRKGDWFYLREADGTYVDNGQLCTARGDAYFDAKHHMWTVQV